MADDGHSDDDNPNEPPVGYGKPPKHTRFKKGASGNPTGRPKKQIRAPNLTGNPDAEAYEKVANQKVIVTAKGEQMTMSLREGILTRLGHAGLQGNVPAAKAFLAAGEKAQMSWESLKPELRSLCESLLRSNNQTGAQELISSLRKQGQHIFAHELQELLSPAHKESALEKLKQIINQVAESQPRNKEGDK